MKNFGKLFAFAIVALGLTACGNTNNNPYGQNGYYNSQTGQWVQTGYNGAQGGCVPLQSGSLSFTAQGASVNGAVILAGMLPANSTRPGQYGQVVMGGTMNQPNYGYGGSLMLTQPQTSSGVIQMTVSQNYASGVIQLNQTAMQAIMQTVGGNMYGGQYNTNICVNSVAIDAVYSATQSYQGAQGMIRQALVYLYLNNSQQPVGPIPFYSGY